MARQPRPLDPGTRSTLRDVLLPPEGYRLHHGLGTAYSLDAETLVTVPLFAAGLGAEELDRPLGIARIYQLGTRLTLLVQGDRIGIAERWSRSRPLLGLLGDAVVPCSVNDGSFHPKLLVLSYAAVDAPDQHRFRVVVATRNLTTDDSWDSVVMLDEADDGVLMPGLADAVSGLAPFVNDQQHRAVHQCRRLGKALNGRTFQPVPGLSDIDVRLLHPGSPAAGQVLDELAGDHLLVISPFVGAGLLDELTHRAGAGRDQRWLVTRPVGVPDSAFAHFQVLRLKDAAVPGHVPPHADSAAVEGRGQRNGQGHLTGLHAKIYVCSSTKGGTRVVVTSANATPAGRSRNVEVAVTGRSASRALQVPALLARSSDLDDDPTFGDLLEEIPPGAVDQDEPEAEWVRRSRRALAGATARGSVASGPPRSLALTVTLAAEGRHWPAGVQATAHPFGYPEHRVDLTLAAGRLTGQSLVTAGIELTPFLVVTVTMVDEPALELVLAMQLDGDLNWDRDDARKTLAEAARPLLLQELLWHFGVRGGSTHEKPHDRDRAGAPGSNNASLLPVLEKILLRVHGPDALTEIATIDGLLAGVEDDPAYADLLALWQVVRSSVR